ncbi:hypothetical protein [Nocardia stercoris]|uniref:Uncharacterized protein n=1 Tax=Nocardia stercoris TaxID=2483361 RepID=A0A3M2LC33_9NOCA|nr:hypothetical protein [Nocardia stercoris]RMI32238.1 hypothetical protein EBN03_14700 [Nocardia stercoris]
MGERSHVRSIPLSAPAAAHAEGEAEPVSTRWIRRRAPLFVAGALPVAALLVVGPPGAPQPMAAAYPVVTGVAHSDTAPGWNSGPALVAGDAQPMFDVGYQSAAGGMLTPTEAVATRIDAQPVSTLDADDPVGPGAPGVDPGPPGADPAPPGFDPNVGGSLTGAAAGAAVGAAVGAVVGATVANAVVSPLTAAGVAVGAVAGFIAGIPFLPAGLVVVPIIGGAIGGAVFVVPATVIGGAVGGAAGALIGAPIGAAIGLTVPVPGPGPDNAPPPPAGDVAP